MVRPAGDEVNLIADGAETSGDRRHKPALVVPKQPEGVLKAGNEREGGDDEFDRIPEEPRAGVGLAEGRAGR